MNRSVKGLLIKDVKLMKSQMRFFFIIMMVWGLVMACNFDNMFLIGYTTVLCSIYVLSTFNYDEFENGAAYLMTLPLLRRDYIREKYLFGLLLSTLPTFMMSILIWMVSAAKGVFESPLVYLMAAAVSLLVGYLLLALEIPLIVKFGREKSRMIVMVVVIGSMGAGYGMIGYLNEVLGIDSAEAASGIAGLDAGVLALLAVAVLAVLTVLSYQLSCRFMEKKEF